MKDLQKIENNTQGQQLINVSDNLSIDDSINGSIVDSKSDNLSQMYILETENNINNLNYETEIDNSSPIPIIGAGEIDDCIILTPKSNDSIQSSETYMTIRSNRSHQSYRSNITLEEIHNSPELIIQNERESYIDLIIQDPIKI
jgi:hypothetical protein